MGIINSNFMTVGSFLGNSKYQIPNYQRVYSWEESELEDMWLDLKEVLQGHNESHFFGQIVIHNNREEGIKYIIDGQQRATTAVILFSVIRDVQYSIYKDSNETLVDAKDDASDISALIIGRYTERKDERNLIQGEQDKDFFGGYIQSETKYDTDKRYLNKAQKRIITAYEYFEKKIVKELELYDTYQEKHEYVKGIYTTLHRKSTIMYIETDKLNEAFIIFETLNARGRDLETADLLKNHIFRVSNTKLEDLKLKWNEMITILGNIDTTKFIRYYWNAQKPFIREKDLYKNIRNQINTPLNAEDLMKDLLKLSEPFSALENPDEDNYYSSEIKLILVDIKTLSAKSYYPIILSMQLKNYDFSEIKDVLKAIETLIVRNFVASGLVANKYETKFSQIAFDIYNEKIVNVEGIVYNIVKLTVSDEEFIYNFSKMEIRKRPTIRYILRKINDYNSKEVKTISDNTKIHIEHIMPIKAGDWTVSEDTHENNLWKLGNLTLLGEEFNRKITNKVFNEKKKVYENSQINITKELCGYEDWNEDSIKKRQLDLAMIANEIWKLKKT